MPANHGETESRVWALIAQIIEPYRGTIHDLACGTGSMITVGDDM